jgi:CubicO group peptidase (beta-lactamase class C family)
MPLHRRDVLIASATPWLAGCATDVWQHRQAPVAQLATRLGVCAAVYATLKAGQPQPPVATAGCQSPVAPDAIFQAASLTKPVVAYGVQHLVQAGVLDLASPVARYLPKGYTHYHSGLRRAPGDPSTAMGASFLAGIPVGTLLNHTSGLPNWSSAGLSLAFAPGERWRYSGEGYVLLQAVVEAVTGVSFAHFMQAQVFQPLGMPDSSLVWQDHLAPRAVKGRSASGAERQSTFGFAVAAASLYARFMAALAADGKRLALTLANPVQVDQALGLEWGQGWGIQRTGTDALLWQWGNNAGFRAFAMLSTSSKDGFVLLTNSDSGMPLAAALAHQTLPGDHLAFKSRLVG